MATEDADLKKILAISKLENELAEEQQAAIALEMSQAEPEAQALQLSLEAKLEADTYDAAQKSDETAEIEAIARYNEDVKREQEHLAVLMEQFKEEDQELELIRQAKELSLESTKPVAVAEPEKVADRKEKDGRADRKENQDNKEDQDNRVNPEDAPPEETEEELLRRAMDLSLAFQRDPAKAEENPVAPPAPIVHHRDKRVAFLNKIAEEKKKAAALKKQ